jgi:hypothetical protein
MTIMLFKTVAEPTCLSHLSSFGCLDFHYIKRLDNQVNLNHIYKNSGRTAKKTPHFTIKNINWLTLFKEIIVVYSANHTKSINTECSVTDC